MADALQFQYWNLADPSWKPPIWLYFSAGFNVTRRIIWPNLTVTGGLSNHLPRFLFFFLLRGASPSQTSSMTSFPDWQILSLEYEYVDTDYLRRKKVPVLRGQYWCFGTVILSFMEALRIEYYAVSVFVHSYLLITDRCNS